MHAQRPVRIPKEDGIEEGGVMLAIGIALVYLALSCFAQLGFSVPSVALLLAGAGCVGYWAGERYGRRSEEARHEK